MSFRVSAAVLYADLPHWEKAILHVLADHADDNGEGVWPSIDRIALLAGRISRRTVQRYMRQIEEASLIVKVRDATRYRPTEYRINVEAIEERRYPELSQGRLTVTPGASDSQAGASAGHISSVPETPDPIQNPSRNLSTNPRDEVWDALVMVMGVPDKDGVKHAPKGKSERGKWNAARKELREIGATPEDVIHRALAYRQKWPGIDLNPRALVNNWDAVLTSAPGPVETRMTAIELARRGYRMTGGPHGHFDNGRA